MHITAPPSLTFDEVDDLLYFTRVNEAQDLQQSISELAQKYECQPRDVLEASVDPESGNTMLHYCSANGFADLLLKLLSQLNSGESNGAADGKVAGPPSLLNRTNKQGNTPLHWAACNGHLEVVKVLLAAGADLWAKNVAGNLAIYEAYTAERSEVAQYLLEVGSSQVEGGRTGGVPAMVSEMEEAQDEIGESSTAGDGGDAGEAADVAMAVSGPSD